MINKVPSKYFIWNGIKSNTYGYLEKTPFPEFSPNNFDIQYIPKLSTPLILSKNTRNKVTISVNLQRVNRKNYLNLYAWLNGNNQIGNLVLCDDLTKYYKAICTSVKPTHNSYDFSSVAITFDCFPFRYAVSNQPITLSESGTITVDGNYYSEPKIVVYGSGNGNLIVNDAVINISLNDYIILDTELGLAYKDNVISMSQTAGNFPTLNPGENSISWNGGVTSVEVFKNERWL